MSKCENTEVCTQEHKCKASWECKKDKHCDKNEFCRKFVPGGKSFCSPLPPGVVQEKPLPDQCGSGLDCQDKGDATVCKEVDGKQICVRPEQCLDQCEDEEVCGAGNQCKPVKSCGSDNDCKTNEVCKRITETGSKTCLLASGVRPPKFDECAMNKDCLVKGQDLICKEDISGIKICVNSTECLSKCQDDQLCDINQICKTPLNCNADIDCKSDEVCRRYVPGGTKTCVLNPRAPLPSKDQCRTNKDCESQGMRTVCKEEEGTRTCVRPEECQSTCGKDEVCDAEQKCRVNSQCDNHCDCAKDQGEYCLVDVSTGIKTCVPLVTLMEMDQCGTSLECKEKSPSRPICKDNGKSRMCVRPDQCLGNCSGTDVCNPKQVCEPLPKCRSDNQCQPWESCQKISEEGRRACLSWRDDDEDQCVGMQSRQRRSRTCCRSSLQTTFHQ